MTIAIVAYDTLRHEKTIRAIKRTIECVPIRQVLWFSDKDHGQGWGWTWIEMFKIDPAAFLPQTSRLCLKWMPSVLKEAEYSHFLFVQSDGYAINPSAWDEEFLEYDYIGAPWPQYEGCAVGNGGFSLRSKKLMAALTELAIPEEWMQAPEDHVLCRSLRPDLENRGIRFAPVEVAQRFSCETPEGSEPISSFGFHGLAAGARLGLSEGDLK